MKWLRKKKNSLLSRTFLASMTVSLTVLLTLAVFLFVWFRNEMADGYRELTRTVIGNTNSSFSKLVSDAKNVTAEWFASADGASLRLDPEADYVRHMSFINKVRSTLDGSSYMQSLCVINRDGREAVTIASNVSHPDHLAQNLLLELNHVEGKNQPFIWSAPKMYAEGERIPILSIPIAESLLSSEQFTGMTVLNIDLSQLWKRLFSEQKNDRFRILVLNGGGVVVCDSSNVQIGEDLSEQQWVRKVLAGERQFTLADDEGTWEFLACESDVDGYYIAARADYVSQILNVNYILYILLAAVAAAALAIILMLLFVSKRIFRPFTSMVGDLKRSKVVDELENGTDAEQDEIVFLEQVYRGMYSHLEQLNQKKEYDFIVKNFLLGNRQQEIVSMLREKGILHDGIPYMMILIYVENEDSREQFSMQEYDMLRTMAGGVYESEFRSLGDCSCLELGLRRVLFFVSPGESRGLEEAVKNANESVRHISSAKCYCLISESMQDEGENCVGYFKRMNNCLKTRHLLGMEETAVIRQEALEEKWDLDALLDAIRDRRKEDFLSELTKLLLRCGEMEYPDFLEHLEWIASSILGAGRLPAGNLKETIASFGEREELFLWLETLFDQAAIQISRSSGSSTAAMMEEAIDYIRSNYDNSSLGVNLLAERLNISTAYFGKLFSEFTGKKTLDYILKVRMEKAQELLLAEPDKTIAQIAVEVGYNNSTYFTTAFKKYFGVTPSRFREYSYTAPVRERR